MVGFAQLRDAQPRLWAAAADDWIQLARQAEESALDIYDQGSAAVTENWTDEVGQRAAQRLTDLANAYQVAAATMRGVATTLDGLGEAVEAVQHSLLSAVDYARSAGLLVGEDGQLARHPTDTESLDALERAQALIAEAVESATRIDEEAAAELNRLAEAVANTDLDRALNEFQASAAHNQIDLFRESLPIGEDPATVAAWWESLTPQQQAEYELAVPVDLHDLNGIPEEVTARLSGADGYDRVEMVRYAQQNWDNTDLDLFDNNCAHFVSLSLEHAGLDSKKDGLTTWATCEDCWGHGPQTGIDWLDKRDSSHSASWADSEAQRDFFVANGAEELPVSAARPGDIIYWEQVGPGGPVDPGVVHHAAVVTAVTPDGDVHYTQHTDSRLDVSLDGRLPANEIHEGDQQPVIVRPRQTW